MSLVCPAVFNRYNSLCLQCTWIENDGKADKNDAQRFAQLNKVQNFQAILRCSSFGFRAKPVKTIGLKA